MRNILDKIYSPDDLKNLSVKELIFLAEQIRHLIIDTVSKTGGHLSSNLGSIELTIALHYCLHMPEDVILFDVGHQAYTHKILTGRKDRFHTLRQAGGISGFPDISESPYDFFTVGHSSTSISWGLGLACARDIIEQKNRRIAIVIGDAALANGMAFEALNHTGHLKKNLIVILNDNELSISPSIGALSTYLNRIASNPVYNKVRKDVEKLLKRVPFFGFRTIRAAKKLEKALKNLLVPGMFFEDLGFRYFGPINGHDIGALISTLKNVANSEGPVLLHLLTKKGNGYKHSENEPSRFHSAAKFEVASGSMASAKAESFTKIFSDKMLDLAEKKQNIVAITAAMPAGTGLEKFSQKYPQRFFDTGIAEEHAVGFAAGLARGGQKPFVAIYSTFLQRAYDQVIHDVCLQKLPVVFCLDRSGIVSDDGATHNGIFDLAYLRVIPNMVIMAPAYKIDFKRMLELAANLGGPCAIRYPKANAFDLTNQEGDTQLKVGQAEILRKGKDAVIFALGSMVTAVLEAAQILEKEDIYVEVINSRFVKPLDESMLREKAEEFKTIFTAEDGVLSGGFGSAVTEFLQNKFRHSPTVKMLGLADHFSKHGKRDYLLSQCGLNAQGIAESVKQYLNSIDLNTKRELLDK